MRTFVNATVTIKKILDRIKVTLYNSDGDEVGTADNPVYVQGDGLGGTELAISTDANVHDADGNDIESSSGSLHIKEDNSAAILADTASLDSNVIKCDTDNVSGSILQNIKTSSDNSTTANIDAGDTFTGTAEATLGINGIQVYHYADQDCALYIDQGLNGTDWDIIDSFTCLANNGCTRTIVSVAPYYRLRITNTGSSATTELRASTSLTPIINPLPRALDNDRLKTKATLYDDVSEIEGKIVPFGKLKTVNPVRTIGASFNGITLDSIFWDNSGCTYSGTAVQTSGGEVVLSTGTTATSVAMLQSTHRSRHVAGSSEEFKFTGRLVTATQADNIRRCGVYDDDNGFFFQVDGTTFGVGTRKDGTDTIINSGDFNGNYGAIVTMDTSMGDFVIWYWERSIEFFYNSKLLHKISATTESLTETLNLPIRIENINESTNVTDNSLEILVASVFRLGNLETSPISYHQSGTTASVVLKHGAGILRTIIIGNVTNNSVITLYDNTAASGTVIFSTGSMGAQTQPYSVNFSALPFNNGLTLVISTANSNATIIYE